MKKIIPLSLALVLFISGLANCRTITVRLDGTGDYTTIQDAIDDCNDGDTVIVAPGRYTGNSNRDIDFRGKAITVRSTDPNDPNVVAATIIDSQGTAKNPHRGFKFDSGEDANSILAGLTITNGCGPVEEFEGDLGTWKRPVGGGIFCDGSSPTITLCRIVNNRAYGFIKYFFVTEAVGGIGAGIMCWDSAAKITSCTISGNIAEATDYFFTGVGGGICSFSDSNVTITDCTITDNSAGTGGGGIYCGNCTISDCTITGNSVSGPDRTSQGGGIYCQGDSATINNCTISNNTVVGARAETDWLGGYCPPGGDAYGGGIYLSGSQDSSLRIQNCSFYGNRAYGGPGGVKGRYIPPQGDGTDGGNAYGGGIYCGPEGRITIENCLLSGNLAQGGNGGYGGRGGPFVPIPGNGGDGGSGYGGGIYASNSYSAVENCTIAGNTTSGGSGGTGTPPGVNGSAGYGYGAGICYGTGGTAAIINCIIWGNDADAIYGTGATVTYSDIEGGWLGGTNIDTDPCFVEPGYWGVNDFWVEGDYHLLPGSPCIDAGMDAGVYTDIEGNIRPYDYPDVDNNGDLPEFDIGAYEVVVPAIEVAMKFTPKVLNPGSKGKWVKAHFVLPEGFVVEDVDANTPAVIEPLGIESDYINVFINEDGLVEIEAAFSRSDFCGATDYGPAEVTVVGLLTSGHYFYGTDTIRIINNNLQYVGVLASHWLEADCGRPDWCGGADVDRDSVVNFVDFALFDGCCIEVIKN